MSFVEVADQQCYDSGPTFDDIQQQKAEEERKCERMRKARAFTPLFCVVVVPLLASFRLKEMAEKNVRTGDTFVFVSKSVLYIPSIIYLLFYPLATLSVKLTGYATESHANIASFALRFLTTFFGTLIVIFELVQIWKCGPDGETICVTVVQIERWLKLFLFIGLSLFVFWNKCYPRKTEWNLFCLTYLLSATIFSYVLTIAAEEKHIHHEVEQRSNHTEHSYLPVQRAYADWRVSSVQYHDSHGDNNAPINFWDGLMETIYAATCEFLVVAISIIIGIICLTGKGERDVHEEHHQLPKCEMTLLIGIVFASAIGLVGALIWLDVVKANHNSFRIKMIFFAVHIIVLIAGTILCAVYTRGRIVTVTEARPLLDQAQQPKEQTPMEMLEKYLLYFGITGFFSYASIGLIHSAYLIPTKFNTMYAIGSLVTNLASMIQGLAQTAVILHCDMVKNKYGFGAGILLWPVNFALFSLDLFDAATLGIYANPIPEGTNDNWAMLVRGLGPFVVFYRFHSLAIITDQIEHHLRIRPTIGLN